MKADKLASFMLGFAFGRCGWPWLIHAFYWSVIAIVYLHSHR